MPVSLVDKIKSIKGNNKSVWERGTFYKDALKIIKKNPIMGMGANAWRYEYPKVQSYEYSAVEVHSYPLQVIMDYGIIAFMALFYMIAMTVKDVVDKRNKESFGITISLLLLLTHSFVDFDMSFFFIMIMFFSLLGITDIKQKEKQKRFCKIEEEIG